MKVLIAEDDPVSRRVLEKALSRQEYEVTTSANGAEAWERFQEDDFDIVISDWIMPEVDGLELVRRIRGAEGSRYAYVVLLTSRSDREYLLRGLEAGADDYLSKPFDPEELRARLRAAERIVALQRRLEKRNQRLQQAFEEIRTTHRRMKDDLKAAASVQRALLPASLPDVQGISFAWRFRPCTELAGDVLNVFPLDEKHVAFYVLDVSGHGVPAALTAVSLSRALMPHADQSSLLVRTGRGARENIQPAEVARRLNLRFTARPMRGLFFTLFYAIVDLVTRELTYVSAGHPGSLLLHGGGGDRALEATGPPIGVLRTSTFEERTISLRPGDRVYVYSDGLTEARSGDNELFGPERLLTALEERRDAELGRGLSHLLEQAVAWTGGPDLHDDATVLALEVDPRQD